jgi:hypothetical protein
MAYQSAGVGAIEAEERDRRLGVGGRLRGLSVAAGGSNGDARSCHSGSPSRYTGGEHGCGCVSGVDAVVAAVSEA